MKRTNGIEKCLFVMSMMLLLLLTACGGGGGGNGSIGDNGNNNPAVPAISISPTTKTIESGESITLTVTASNTGITWPGKTGDTANYTQSGNSASWTPPAEPGTYSFTVTATADTSKKATATITVKKTPIPPPPDPPIGNENVFFEGLTEIYKGDQVEYSPEIGYSNITGELAFNIESPIERDAWLVLTGKNNSQETREFNIYSRPDSTWVLAGWEAFLPGVEKQFLILVHIRQGSNRISFYNGANSNAPILVNVKVIFDEPRPVPNVVGKAEFAAKTAITGAGLVVGTITTVTSSTVAAGSVISQNPAAGASVAKDSTVHLVVASVPPAPPDPQKDFDLSEADADSWKSKGYNLDHETIKFRAPIDFSQTTPEKFNAWIDWLDKVNKAEEAVTGRSIRIHIVHGEDAGRTSGPNRESYDYAAIRLGTDIYVGYGRMHGGLINDINSGVYGWGLVHELGHNNEVISSHGVDTDGEDYASITGWIALTYANLPADGRYGDAEWLDWYRASADYGDIALGAGLYQVYTHIGIQPFIDMLHGVNSNGFTHTKHQYFGDKRSIDAYTILDELSYYAGVDVYPYAHEAVERFHRLYGAPTYSD